MFYYFSDLLNKNVLTTDRVYLGKLHDLFILTNEVYPKATVFVVKEKMLGRKFIYLPWNKVETIEEVIRVKINGEKFSNPLTTEEISLRHSVLDKQVVDIYNRKVIRVNDIHLLKVDNELRLAHVDVGLRGVVRSLGWEKIVDFIIKRVYPRAGYLKREHLISWKYIQPLPLPAVTGAIKLTVTQKQLSQIPIADLSEILLDLDVYQRLALFRSLNLDTKAHILDEVNVKIQQELLEGIEDYKEKAKILEKMAPDRAVDLLAEMPRNAVKELLVLVESSRAHKLSTLLGYASDSAGGLMTTEFIAFPETVTVEEALEKIKNSPIHTETFYIVDAQNHLVGSINLRRLIGANPKEPIVFSMTPRPICVYLHDSAQEVAYLMDKYKRFTIPVMDKNKVLQGVITIDDLFSQVISLAWRRRLKKHTP